MLKELTEVYSICKEDAETKFDAFAEFMNDYRYSKHKDFGIVEMLDEDEELCWFIFEIKQSY